MKVCKFLMVLVAMWGLVSCGWLGEDVDVAAGVILRYNNETEHLIQIKDVNAYGYNVLHDLLQLLRLQLRLFG